MMMRALAALLVAAAVAGAEPAKPLPTPEYGAGTEFDYDAGYVMRVKAVDGTVKEVWQSVPIVVVVVGLETRTTKPCYSCVKKGTEKDPAEYYLIPLGGIEEAKLRKVVKGKLPKMTTDLPIRCEK
jgi:hypothetical protein